MGTGLSYTGYDIPSYMEYNYINMNEEENVLDYYFNNDRERERFKEWMMTDKGWKKSYVPAKFSDKHKKKMKSKSKTDWKELVGCLVLVSIGDSPFLYECIIREVSIRTCAVLLMKSNRKNAKTISSKQECWWRAENLTYVDSLDNLKEPEMIRKIL